MTLTLLRFASLAVLSGSVVACAIAQPADEESAPLATSLAVTEPPGACEVAPGRYMVKYTLRTGGFSCTPFWQRVIDSNGRPEDDASAGCAIVSDPSTCTATIDCETIDGSTSSKTKVITTVAAGAVTGSFVGKVTLSGSLVSDCSYDLVWAAN